MNNSCVQTLSVSNQQGVFQGSVSFPCDNFGVKNYVKTLFVDFVSHWLFSKQPLLATPAIVNIDELWEARVTDHTNEVLVRGPQYKHVTAVSLELGISFEDLGVLMAERATAAWEQLFLRNISDGIAIHAPLDESGFIPFAVHFHFLPPLLFISMEYVLLFCGGPE